VFLKLVVGWRKRMIKDKKQKENSMQPLIEKYNDDILVAEIEEDKEDGSNYDGEIVDLEEEIDTEEKTDIDENDSDYKNMKVALDFINTDNKVVIDREQEDKDVVLYQETKNKDLLGKLYLNRIPTLQFWANKNFYPGLTTSVEDLFGDLSVVFIKAVSKYNKKRGSFNTCLFTFLLNRIKNMKNSQHAKKRISEEYSGPLSGMMLSLDFSYDDKDGAEATLKDIIPEDKKTSEDNINFNEIVNILSKNDLILKDFFLKIGEGHSLAYLLKQSKFKTGELHIDLSQYDLLKTRRNKSLVKKILKDKGVFETDFTLVNYTLGCLKINYTVELNKTKEFMVISKAIREIRNHKEYYVSKLKGDNK
jgi:hypothetical protein